MEINWFTFGAQIFNFLVLVALLKRFLYAPIIGAMDEREKKIAARLEDAAKSKREMDRQAEEFRQKNQQLVHAREELLARASREVEAWSKEHLKQAREQVDHNLAEWFRAVKRERDSFLQEMRRRTAKQVHEMARHVLTQLCNAQLEQQVIDSFLTRLQKIDERKRHEITDSIRNSQHKILVESAFEIPHESRQQISSTIRDHLTDGVDIDFKTVPELICGIELKAAGYKVAWSVGESLQTLEEEFDKALNEAISE